MKLLPITLHKDKQLTFSYKDTSYAIHTKSKFSLLIGTIAPSMPRLPAPITTKSLEHFTQEKEKFRTQLEQCEKTLASICSDNPLAFWDKEKYFISLPTIPNTNPTKASHAGMNIEDTDLCRKEIQELLEKGLIEKTNSPWACQAFYVNKHSEQKRGKKRLVINYQPLNKVLVD